jgi:hypothetical protein
MDPVSQFAFIDKIPAFMAGKKAKQDSGRREKRLRNPFTHHGCKLVN